MTALFDAVERRDLKLGRLLLEYGAEPDEDASLPRVRAG